ncbi:Tetratricopeptide repeat-containing protein [Reichenbachiella faecimaris]|uniref:histidine kinase n=1 Tax=Reichenbachiella faecimaris TaxID=692418 RepID=A0A1W2G742_REIFA|nr:tetratricopeptide repeat-containing sensor histidine kinase [Reichenbachiella faecimaris]SMD32495.1 Tetratricopeptide repeat-containing protein [Reichenbachiella faecimaris]
MRILKNLIITYVLLSSFFHICAQTPELDSLQNSLSQRTVDNIEKVDLLLQISLKSNRYDLNKTYEYSQAAFDIADSIGYINGQAQALRMIAEYYMRRPGNDKDTALVILNDALDIQHGADDGVGIGRIYRSMGTCYFFLNKFPEALDYSYRSLELLEKSGLNEEVANVSTNIGSMHLMQRNFDQALDYYLRALGVFEELAQPYKIGVCTFNIADVYLTLGNSEKAEEYLAIAMPILKELNLVTMLPSGLNSYGRISLMQGEYTQALEYFKKALEQNESMEILPSKCDNLIGLTETHLTMGQYSRAKKYGEEALELAKSVNIVERRRQILELMSQVYAGLGKFKEAYEIHTTFKSLSDSLFNELNIKKITGLEYQYEFEKEKEMLILKQKEKDVLQQSKIERELILRNSFIAGFILLLLFGVVLFKNLVEKRKANKKLEAINKSKDDIFAVISHDLRSPVGNIKAFIDLIISSPNQYDQKETMMVLAKLGAQSTTVYNILENLLVWAKSQRKGTALNLEEQPVQNVIFENVNLLQEKLKEKQIQIENEVDESLTMSFDHTLISTVVRNVLANAIKFSKDGGKILIHAVSIDQGVKVSISDHGVGMDAQTLEGLFDQSSYNSSSGTHEERGSGLGLKLCKDFVEMHGGSIWMESKEGQGSTCHFTLNRLE